MERQTENQRIRREQAKIKSLAKSSQANRLEYEVKVEKRGRKKLPLGKKKDTQIIFRVSENQKFEIQKLAESVGLSVSELITVSIQTLADIKHIA